MRVAPDEAEAFVQFVERARSGTPPPNRLRGAYCQDVPGGRCWCRCHAERKAKHPSRWDAWLPSHDDALRSLIADGAAPERCAEILSERFPVFRSRHAVQLRIKHLGLSSRDGWVSGEDLIRLLGVYRRRIQQFEARGLLTPNAYGRWRRYRAAEVEALISSEAGATIDPRRVRDPRFRSLAETAAIANRRRATG